MVNKQSKWQTEELAAAFLDGVRGAIPEAGLQLELMSYIIRAWCPRPRQILDLGCGDGALGRFLLDQFPKARVIFADFSEPMLKAAKKRLGENPRAALVKADFSSRSWVDGVRALRPVDVVVSGFAIHHQPDQRKKELYAEVFGFLRDGGLFLNLEHVAPVTSNVGHLFDNYFIDHLYRFHRKKNPTQSREEVEKAYYNRPDKEENLLAPVDVQCEWLRLIGFTDVECFFKVFELALFGGRKAAVPS
jgi:tRNA (cmo5U34)-methyltransferase